MATSSRRAPPASAVQTIRPPAVLAGTPRTISSQCGSVSVRTTAVAPVAASTARTRISRWSLVCTTISGVSGATPSQHAVTRYGNAARSHATGVGSPPALASTSETSALGVPATG